MLKASCFTLKTLDSFNSLCCRFQLKWNKVYTKILSEKNNIHFWIPEGYAHGFLVLSKTAIINYLCTKNYNPNKEITIKWDDSDIDIKWPNVKRKIVSKKDKLGLKIKDI